MSAMAQSSWSENRRVSNQLLCEQLYINCSIPITDRPDRLPAAGPSIRLLIAHDQTIEINGSLFSAYGIPRSFSMRAQSITSHC